VTDICRFRAQRDQLWAGGFANHRNRGFYYCWSVVFSRLFPFRLISRVRLAHLSHSSPSTTQNLATKTLFSWDTTEGWKIDNFEGLARLDQERYLMVSDDNANPLQRTLLVLLKLDTTFP